MALNRLESRGRRALWAALAVMLFGLFGLQAAGSFYLWMTGDTMSVEGRVCGLDHRWIYDLQADGSRELTCAKVEDKSN